MTTDLTPLMSAVDLFAGPGGWDVAAKRLDIDVLGFEYDDAANTTRAAAGHPTIPGDLAALNPRQYARPGQISSPPCQGFSMAGKGKARADSEKLLAALEGCRTRGDVETLIADAHSWMTDPGTALVLEPLRWALTNTPSWLAWEQVPAVLPIWQACARILERIGYSTATGCVQAEQYGVPQTRKRAIFLARAPWLTAILGPVHLPAPTHSKYHPRSPGKIDPGMPRWVSMAEALEWGATARPGMTVTGGGTATGGAEPFGNAARTGLKRERDAGRWTDAAGDPITDGSDEVWQTRPATTVVASYRPDVIAGPGYRKPGDGPRQNARGSVRVTVQEAAILQTFPADYPWQGTKTKQFQQVGNAVPPLLAEAVLCAVLDLPFRGALRGDS